MACPFGFRFLPTEEELVIYYLGNKITGNPLPCEGIMIERNIYGENGTPWELFRDDDPVLPWHIVLDGLGKVVHSETVLYVFTRLTRVGKVGSKQKMRVAGCGAWHGNTTPEGVLDGQGNQIGYKKTFKFRHNKKEEAASEWIMHEYSHAGCDDFVLCKIKRTESRGKKLESSKRTITDCAAESTRYVDGQRLRKKIKSGTTSCSTATTSDTGLYCLKNKGTNTVGHLEIHCPRTDEEVGNDHADPTWSGIQFMNERMNPVMHQEIQCPTVNEEANSALGDGVASDKDHPTIDDQLCYLAEDDSTLTESLTSEEVAYAGFLDEYLDN